MSDSLPTKPGIGPGAGGSSGASAEGGELVYGLGPQEIPHARELAVALEAAEAGAGILRSYFRTNRLEVRQKQDNDFVTRADEESERAILEVVRGAFPDHGVLAEESGRSIASSTGDGGYEWIIDPLDGTSNFLHGLPVFCISIACRRFEEDGAGGEIVVGVVLDPLGNNVFSATRGGGARWNGEPMKVTDRQGLEGAFLATGYPFRAKGALELYLEIFHDFFAAARGIRRCGAAALDLAYTAAGVYDGFFEFRLSPWDIAAGSLLVEEAGGVLTDLDGNADLFGRNFRGGGRAFGGNVIAGPEGLHRVMCSRIGEHADEAKLDALSPVSG